jgi:hypothetical protein
VLLRRTTIHDHVSQLILELLRSKATALIHGWQMRECVI